MFKQIALLIGWISIISTGVLAYNYRDDILKYISDFSNVEKIFTDVISKLHIEEVATNIAKNVSVPPPLRGDFSGASNATLTVSGTVSETNKQRQLNGNLPPLSINARLNAAANAKADDMFAKQYFEHVSPSGRGPSHLAESAGYEYIMIGENLALGNFKGDADLVTAWMNSPGHRANILNGKYTEIGVAVKKGTFEGRMTWIAVQEFGRPLSSCPPVNSSLKAQIDENQGSLNVLNAQITAKKEEIDNHRPKWGREYNEKVDEYNALVAQYNALAEATKGIIATYNAQVNAFNNCLQQ